MRLRNLTAVLCLGLAPLAQAQEKTVDMCVFDLIGASGDQYALVENYAIDMREKGVKFNLEPYTDEGVAMSAFSAGDCDALAATDLRIRRYNGFTGTLSAVGAIPSYKHLEMVLAAINKPKASKYMKEGDYEIAGIFPAGAAYLFVTDRDMDTVEELAGKRIATLNHHPDAVHMVNYVNASVEPSEITDFGGKFNNRSVDAAYAPGWAYEALELYRGIGDEGGVVDYPLGQLTMQIVVRDDALTEEQAQTSREVAFNHFDDAIAKVEDYEADIPDDTWIEIPDSDIEDYQEMFRQNRIELRDGVTADGEEAEQVYNGQMLTLLRKVRCRIDPEASECTAPDRE
ncbi:putative solute-binding protein [Halomonadaceae bacterium KBTZ08]